MSDDWRFDYEQWPGPPDQSWRLPWASLMADIGSAFYQTFAPAVRRYGKTFTQLQTGFDKCEWKGYHLLDATLDEINDSVDALTEQFSEPFDAINRNQKSNVGAGRVRNRGPRSNQTFDRRGRRRY